MAESKTSYEIEKTEQEWREILSPEQFNVLRKHGNRKPIYQPFR